MSQYHGDIRLGDTIDIKFTTRQISGAPFTLAGTPVVSAYPANSTTELTAGITLSVDFDSRTGLNSVRVVASSGNGYATATNYELVITTGTVNSVSVVGECIGSFSIENRSALMPATAGRTLVVDAAGLADANAVKIGPTGAGTAQTARDVGASVLLSTGTGTGQLDFTAGVVKSNLAQILGTALTETAGQIAAAFKQFFNIASPTSTMNTITTVTTATNLTNAATAGDLTATMKTSVTTAATAATPTAAAVTARVTANTDQLAGQAVTAAAGVTFPASVASPTNITAGTITTVTNLTNAPTNGDLTATMKASVTTAATAATPAVASVTGDVGGNVLGNVSGSVGSVTGLTASNLDATISSRLAASSYTAPPSAATIAAAVWSTVIEGAYTAGSYMRLFAAALLGKASGMATTTATFRDTADTTDRIVATVDSDGNRSAVTLDAS